MPSSKINNNAEEQINKDEGETNANLQINHEIQTKSCSVTIRERISCWHGEYVSLFRAVQQEWEMPKTTTDDDDDDDNNQTLSH